jgi:hypothetical protein
LINKEKNYSYESYLQINLQHGIAAAGQSIASQDVEQCIATSSGC